MKRHILHELPHDPSGYGDVSYSIVERDLNVEFEYSDKGSSRTGRLRFHFFVHFCIVSETQQGVGAA